MEPTRPTIRSTADLVDVWRLVDGGHGYSAPQLFVMLIDRDDAMTPHLVHLYDDDLGNGDLGDGDLLTRAPDLVDAIGRHLAEHAPGGSAAVLRARPGSPLLTPADRRFCQALHQALRAAPFASRPLVLATDSDLGVVPPDALIPDT